MCALLLFYLGLILKSSFFNPRPGLKELLSGEYFMEEMPYTLEIIDRDREVESQGHLISIRLKVAEEKKSRRAKPAHKEGEAIQFEFNLDSDDCYELAKNMVSCDEGKKWDHVYVPLIIFFLLASSPTFLVGFRIHFV